jgi:hypothetical protein
MPVIDYAVPENANPLICIKLRVAKSGKRMNIGETGC